MSQSEDAAWAAQDWQALEDLAKIAYENGDVPGAKKLLERASSAPNCGVTVWANLGLICMDIDDYLGAVHAYSRAALEDVSVRVNRGLAYERLGDLRSARLDYIAALAVDPDDVDALVNLGTLDLSNGDVGAARASLERAAGLDPRANWQLSDVLLEVGNLEMAAGALQEAINAGEARAYLDLARVERDRGRVSRSDAAYKKEISYQVDDAEAEHEASRAKRK